MDKVNEIVQLMLEKPGSCYAGFDASALSVLIRHNWDSGQWVILTDEEDNLQGWLGWMTLDGDSLAVIREQGFVSCIRSSTLLFPGDHVYLTHCITAPGVPQNTYRRLYGMAVERNPQAKTINAHLINRRGNARWFSREV